MKAVSRRPGSAPARPRVGGLDLSLTGTGVATTRGSVHTISCDLAGARRLDYVERTVLELLADATLVFIELYAYSRGGAGKGGTSQAHSTGELGGVIRLGLFRAGIPYEEISTSSLKVFGAGAGNAAKAMMITEAVKRLGLEPRDDNQADAAWLREMGLHWIGMPTVTLPKSHTRALDALDRAK